MPAITSGLLLIIGLAFLPETYAPRVLQLKAARERKSRSDTQLYTVLDLDNQQKSINSIAIQFLRPVIYLILDPALLLASWFFSVVFGVIYLVIVTVSIHYQLPAILLIYSTRMSSHWAIISQSG